MLLITRFIKGWDELPDFETDKSDSQIPVTIITAFKNEEENISELAKALDNQSFQNFEWILVNDHSTDKSEEIIKNIIESGFPGIKLLKNKGKGKKEAIRTAIENAKNELIISLDADVFPSENWLTNVVAFQSKFPCDLLICPVKISFSTSLFGKFQLFEFASLIATGAGAAKIGMPILCNGANLAFNKSVWIRNEENLHFKELSGDDIYLLQAVKKQSGVIRFLKSKNAIVETNINNNIGGFLRQRMRWAGKKAMYRDKELLITALITFLMSATVLATAIVALFKDYYPSLLLLIFIAKLAVDATFFWKIKDFFELKNVVVNSLVFSLFYPFYIVFTSISSMFRKNKW